MKEVTEEYRNSMRQPFRNRAYIRAVLGVINHLAQDNADADIKGGLTPYSAPRNVFEHKPVRNIYATREEHFCKVDGSQYFCPVVNRGDYYNNGMVTEAIAGDIRIEFPGLQSVDLKGLTIDWGDNYPVDFTLSNGTVERKYTGNNSRYWQTEDVFDKTSFLLIHPLKMQYANCLRIYDATFGIANSFGNAEVLKYTSSWNVPQVSEKIPANKTMLKVDNSNSYYDPDNPESAIAYMQMGDKLSVQFGYDVTGEGDIEWLDESVSYLSNWQADSQSATFYCTDRYSYLNGKYYRGTYHSGGISLYDLAQDVFKDAGLKPNEYKIDKYLRRIHVRNPMPVVTHAEALQIIANAARAILYETSTSQLCIQYSGKLELTVDASDEEWPCDSVLSQDPKQQMAFQTQDYATVDGKMTFSSGTVHPIRRPNVGYVSENISNASGIFNKEIPTLEVSPEAPVTIYGVSLEFYGNPAEDFTVTAYSGNTILETISVTGNKERKYELLHRFSNFDRIVVRFTKTKPFNRITVGSIFLRETTDYVITKNDVRGKVVAERKAKVKTLNVNRKIFTLSPEDSKELVSDQVTVSPENNTVEIFLSNPGYGFSVTASEVGAQTYGTSNVSVQIEEAYAYYVKLRFNVAYETRIAYKLSGKFYSVANVAYTKHYNPIGQEISWSNPLVSDSKMSEKIEQWLAAYYLGDVGYQFDWRGDPATEANDTFLLERKEGETALIRTYENSITFDGSWKGHMKARKVVQ